MTIRERILAGLASLRQSQPQMTADEQAELARVEAVAKGETPANPAAQETDKGKETVAANPQLSADVQALLKTVNAQSEQIASLTATIGAQQTASQQSADNTRVDTLVRQMKMTPAEAVTWKQLAKDNPAAFQAAFTTQEARPVLPQIKGNSIKARTEMSGEPGAELARLAQARAKEAKISLGAAAKQIVAERPDLATAHADSAPGVIAEGAGN